MDGSWYKYIEKSEGPSTDPWGTPYFIGEGEEKELYILHWYYRQIDMK